MKNSNIYLEQVTLLLRCLPVIAEIDSFALKGDTAINFFVRDFPRLSVDIDLTYLPIEDRATTLIGIENNLKLIKAKLLKQARQLQVIEYKNSYINAVMRLIIIAENGTSIKIEPDLILRGSVYLPEVIPLAKTVIERFQIHPLSMRLVSKADLYGGKICAALDRQHPKDLFDGKILLANEGVTLEIKNAFLIYLISGNRPMHELLWPNMLDLQPIFIEQFAGMSNIAVTVAELEQARADLIMAVHRELSIEDKEFLLSFKQGHPKWELINLPYIAQLPGIRWKLMNIQKMDLVKHKKMLKNLEQALEFKGSTIYG